MSEYYPKYLSMRTVRAKLVIDFIRNYDSFVEEAENMLSLNMGIKTDGQPHGTGYTDPVAITAEHREKIIEEITAIEEGIKVVPEEYRTVVWRWVKDGIPLYKIPGAYASDRTFGEYKKRFVTEVARRKGWYIDDI